VSSAILCADDIFGEISMILVILLKQMLAQWPSSSFLVFANLQFKTLHFDMTEDIELRKQG
jgi:hypothetical protein